MKAGFNLLLWTSHVTEQHFPIIEKLARALDVLVCRLSGT